MDAEQISKNYDLWIVVRRWAATWLDTLLFVLVGVLLIPLGKVEIAGAIGIGLLFIIVYYPLTEGLVGKTVGKFLCGLTVVDRNGAAPGIKKAMVRTLWRLLEINPLLVGALPAGIAVLSSKTKQRCGDNMAGTYVVCDEDLGSSWARRFWALPSAVLTTLAAVAFFVLGGTQTRAADRQKPHPISFAEIVSKPPKEGYFTVKDCEIDITEALYEQTKGEYSTTYTAYIPLKLPSMKKAPIVLKTQDEKTVAILKKFDALETAEAGEKVLDTFIEEHLDELAVVRTVEGTISTGDYNVNLSDEKGEEFKKESLAENFVVLEEGDKPFAMEGIFSILAGVILGGLTGLLWIIALVYASVVPALKRF
ncbi:MAG: RDD family protein [Armatimonas sp.]